MVRYKAAWLLPISRPPVRDGWIDVADGRIVQVATAGEERSPLPRGSAVIDLGPVAILPGLVNAHTHLELSSLEGLVPPASSMPQWVRTLMAVRRAAGTAAIVPGIVRAIEAARRTGTAVLGDISNTLASCAPLRTSALRGVIFHELLKFNAAESEQSIDLAVQRADAVASGERFRVGLAAHAPYSVAPELFRAMMRRVQQDSVPTTVHLAESIEELEFLRSGTGEWRTLLEDIGAWDPVWRPPDCGPVEYLQRLDWIRPGTIVVHGVHLSEPDLTLLAAAGCTVVTCPRSNAWTGAGVPPLDAFFASGARIAIGTDSLASVADLNMFAELAVVRRLAPRVPARRLLDSATRSGAEALGLGLMHGTLEPGRSADLLVVRIPVPVEDVEEYLVSGVPPDAVSWLGHEADHASGRDQP